MPDWSAMYEARRSVSARFGDIWDLPVVKRYHVILESLGGAGTRVLEVGAGERKLARRLQLAWGDHDYRSCDLDRRREHDFYDIGDVSGEYDLVCGLEVIEHLSLEAACAMLEHCFTVTAPGGLIALTTPNTFYPPAFMRDATHVTPFCYDELGAVVTLAGYEVTGIYRLYHDALVKRLLRRRLAYPIFRLLGIDFAHQIMVVGRRA